MKTISYLIIVVTISYINCRENKCDKDEDCHNLCPEDFDGKCTIKCHQRSCTVQMVPKGPYIIVEKNDKCATDADCNCPKDIIEGCTPRCSQEKCLLEVTPRAPVLVMDGKESCRRDGDCECPVGEAVAHCKPLCVGNLCSFSIKSNEKSGSDYNDLEEDHTCDQDTDCKHLCPEVFEGTCIPHCRESSCNLGLIPPYPVPVDMHDQKPDSKKKKSNNCKGKKCSPKRKEKRSKKSKCKNKKCAKKKRKNMYK